MRRFFDRVRSKLADQQGDSMVEALAGILIAVLGATMLATMVMASVNVSTTSQRALDASYEAETKLLENAGKQPVKASVKLAGSASIDISVTLYKSGDFEYYRPVATEATP